MYELEFDWVLLTPDPGHIKMNIIRSLVEFSWEIFWKSMSICLNFRSENVQKAAKRVTDHHKGWHLLRITQNNLFYHLSEDSYLILIQI